MKTITRLFAILLAGACVAAPAYEKNYDNLIVTKDLYVKDFAKQKSKYDIVKIFIPINGINFQETESPESNSSKKVDIVIFFVEADVDDKGNRVYKGIYSLKNGKVKKVLENGRDVSASEDTSKLVFFGASDGIYVYKKDDDSAVKYGSIDDSIIGIAKESSGDVIYILTDDNIVYKVSENGTKKEKLEDVVNTKHIALDSFNNLFFLSDDKVPHVRTAEGVKRIEGLPENPSYVELIKPQSNLRGYVQFVSDGLLYSIYANGTSKYSGFEFKAYTHDKKNYEYKMLALTLGYSLDAHELLSAMSDGIEKSNSKVNNNRR